MQHILVLILISCLTKAHGLAVPSTLLSFFLWGLGDLLNKRLENDMEKLIWLVFPLCCLVRRYCIGCRYESYCGIWTKDLLDRFSWRTFCRWSSVGSSRQRMKQKAAMFPIRPLQLFLPTVLMLLLIDVDYVCISLNWLCLIWLKFAKVLVSLSISTHNYNLTLLLSDACAS